jgi:hypothetical protein
MCSFVRPFASNLTHAAKNGDAWHAAKKGDACDSSPLHACECNDHTHLRVYKHARLQVRLGKRCTIEGFAPEIKHALTTHVKPGPGGRKYLDVDLNTVKSAGFDSVFAPRGNRDKNGVQFDEYVTPSPNYFLKKRLCSCSTMFYRGLLCYAHFSSP